MQNSNYILSCDIGGSHITSAIVEAGTWKILGETITRSSVNSLTNAKSIFLDWTSNMEACLKKVDQEITRIGIAAPGPFDYENGIALMQGQAKYDSLFKMGITKPIQEGLRSPHMDIRYINDAAAFLQGEIYGSGLIHQSAILGITLGTGLGSAVWEQGAKAFDAALWDSPYRESIFEEYLVTRWLVKRFEELSGIRERGLREILVQHGGHPELEKLLREYRQHLLDFFHFFSEKYQSRHFIVGGNIAKAWDRIFPNKACLSPFDIHVGKYQEHAAIIGAASLFSNDDQFVPTERKAR